MVQPINYALDVLSPIQGALRGYQLGREDIGQRQVMQEREQMMGFRAAQEQRAQQQFAAQQAQAAQARAAAESGQAALLALHDKLAAGTATPADVRRAMLENPGMAEQFQALSQSFTAERMGNEQRFGQQLAFLLAKGNTDFAQKMLEERRDAAIAAGDQQSADAYEASILLLAQDPNSVLTGTLAPLVETMDPDDFDKFYKTLGIGGEDSTEAVRTLQQRAALAGLVPGTPEYIQFMVTGGRQDGFAVRVTPEGGVEFVQGVAAAIPFREQESKDIVYAARAQGALAALDPVADQLASLTPRLLEYVPLGQGRRFQDPLFQVANNAGLEFLAAILRKDTGAAITAQEIEIYGQTYLPQPGDSAEALAKKKEARQRAVSALQAPMRPEAAAAVSGALGETAAPPSATPPASFVNDPTVQRLISENAAVGITAESMWNAMTPEERAVYGR